MNAPAHFGSWSTLTEPPTPAHTCPGCDDAVDQPGPCAECAATEARTCKSCGEQYDTPLDEHGLCGGCEQIEREWI